VHAKTIES